MRNIDLDRVVLPRWRSLEATIDRGELSSNSSSIAPSPDLRVYLSHLEARFGVLKSLESAADLIAFAAGWGLPCDDSVERAARIVEARASPNVAVHFLALRFLGMDRELQETPPSAKDRIAGLKVRVRANPRDSLSWLEMARWQAALGNLDKAREAVMCAVLLVDSDRYIVRSAARFYCHVEEFDAALWVLR